MNITVYSKPNCPDCQTVKGLLKSKNLEFTEINLTDPKALSDFIMKYPSIRKMPQVEVNGKRVEELNELLAL